MRRVVALPFPSNPQVRHPADLGRWLRAARTQAGLPIHELALWLGLSRGTILDLEAGAPTVALGTALRVTRALGLRLDGSIARVDSALSGGGIPSGRWALVDAAEAVDARSDSDQEKQANTAYARGLAQAVGLGDVATDAPSAQCESQAVGFPALFAALDELPRPLQMRRWLLRRVLFAVATADPEAGLGSYRLAVAAAHVAGGPLQRPLIGRAPGVDRAAGLPVPIGEATRFEALSAIEWARFAHRCALPARLVARELGQLAKAIATQALPVALALIGTGQPEAITRACARSAAEQAQRMALLARAIAQVPPALSQ